MPYSPRVVDAFSLASELHAAQTRKGSDIPYVTHLMAVAGLVGEFGGSEDQVIAALLHDAAEDQGGEATLAAIRDRFGDTVAGYVDGCSDTFEDPKPAWQERKQAFLDAIAQASPELRLIVACDKLHNTRSLTQALVADGDGLWDRFTGGRDGTLWYYAECVLRLSEGWSHPVLRELAHAVDRLQRAAAGQAKPGAD
jgi:(p)ppGpp synthase/HD superfamily hydrolase